MFEIKIDVKGKDHLKIINLLFKKCCHDEVLSYETNGFIMKIVFKDEKIAKDFEQEVLDYN